MQFVEFIGAVASLVGPVVKYEHFPMTDHIVAEYVESVGGQCTIGISYTRFAEDSVVSWADTYALGAQGGLQYVADWKDTPLKGTKPTGYLTRGGAVLAHSEPGDVKRDVKTTYAIIPTEQFFTVDVHLQAFDRQDKVTADEKATVYCNTKSCSCSVKGFPDR